MSFIKKTWLARIGTGLNRFLQNGTDYVTLQSAPEAVTQQGDALSADNMNNLEQRITDAFDETAENFAPIETSPSTHNYSVGDMLVYNGVLYEVTTDIATGNALTVGTNIEAQNVSSAISGKADKVISPTSGDIATLDSNGNIVDSAVPISTVLKQSDVIDNLTSPVTDKPLSANMGMVIGATLNQHDSRLQNLEQKAGDYIEVQYRGTDAVPTGKAKYALVNTIVGKTRAWNQLYNISNQSGIDSSGITLTVGTTYLTINGTASSAIYKQTPSTFKFVSGHKYMFIMSGWSDTKCYLSDQSGLNVFGSGTRLHQNIILTAVASGGDLRITIPSGSAFTNVKMTLNCYDLTLIFGAGNEPSTVAEALAQLPALGKYNAYGYSLPSTIVSGMKSVGVNIWNEEWENGYYTASGKQTGASYIRSKNYIKGFRNIYFNAPVNLDVYGYSSDTVETGTLIGNGIKNTNVDASLYAYIRFSTSASGTSSYGNNIQLCDNSLPDAVKQTYHPYKTDTLFLSTPVTLKSAGSVAEELDVESGVVTHPVGSVDLGDFTWSYVDNTSRPPFWLGTLVGVPLPVMGSQQICSGGYSTLNPFGSDTDKIIYVYVAGGSLTVALRDSAITNSSSFSGMMLNYELATPDPSTNIGATPYNFIEVQGGGTVETIQTQTPVIDNCLDVGYLAL